MNNNVLRAVVLLWTVWALVSIAASVQYFSLGNEEVPNIVDRGSGGNQTAALSIGMDPSILQGIMFVFYSASIVAIGYMLITGKKRAAKTLAIYFIVLLISVGLFVGITVFSERIKRTVDSILSPSPGGGSGGMEAVANSQRTNLILMSVIGIVMITAVVAYVISLVIAARKYAQDDGDHRKEHARRAVDDAISSIVRGDDPRSVVIRCYNDMCRIVLGKGVKGFRPLTPSEFKVKIKEELGVIGSSVDQLTSLFEEARYSHHQIGEGHRERALEALRAFGRELGGDAHAPV